jgi:hypothetical protein
MMKGWNASHDGLFYRLFDALLLLLLLLGLIAFGDLTTYFLVDRRSVGYLSQMSINCVSGIADSGKRVAVA